LSLGFAGNLPPKLIPELASQQIYVAPRLGRMRVSPHVYNDEADVDRFVAAMKRALVAPKVGPGVDRAIHRERTLL
jgi:selenocysteine lyase/cysteine desulfurase